MFSRSKAADRIRLYLKDTFNLYVVDGEYIFSAFIHSSYSYRYKYHQLKDYERLEFLGDSFIRLIIAHELFNIEKDVSEMSSRVKRIVQSESLVYTAKKIKLDKYILVGKSCSNITDSIIEDVYESFIGAVFLEFGYEAAKKILKDTLWKNYLNEELDFVADFKTRLQELVIKKYKTYPEYKQLSLDKDGDVVIFNVGVFWNEDMKGQGSSTRLKNAEKIAAKIALDRYFKNAIKS